MCCGYCVVGVVVGAFVAFVDVAVVVVVVVVCSCCYNNSLQQRWNSVNRSSFGCFKKL